MQTIQLTVGTDGHVTVPGTQPGQTVTIKIPNTPETSELVGSRGPIPEEGRAAIEEIRRRLPEPWLSSDHGDLL